MAELESSDSQRLCFHSVSKRFGPTVALEDIDLSVSPGQVHALIGENGAGKSTLMNILSGSMKADSGSMTFHGRPYHPANPLDAQRSGVTMVHQELALIPHLSVAENLFLGDEPTCWGLLRRKSMKERTRQALQELEHSDIPPTAKVASLSVGAQQIVEIARGLIADTKVLILDEPTSSLPQDDVRKLFRLIERLKNRGLAILYISHFLEEVQEIADCFTVLRDGRVAGNGEIASTSLDTLIRLMVGRDIEDMFPKSHREPGETLVEVSKLEGDTFPCDASFVLRRGEVLGIAGLMGSGRTEMIRAIFGLDKVRNGEIKVGVFSGAATPQKRLSQGVGLLSEDRKDEGIATGLSLTDNLVLSKLDGLGPFGLISPRKANAIASKWLKKLSVRCRGPFQKASELSGGNQQKLAIARLLYHDVEVLLLDEPTRGIDVASKAEIYHMIDELATVQGKAILLISSYLPELLGVADRIAVMSRGILGPGHAVEDLSENSIMLECTGQTIRE